jgi:hypothetical protein
VPFGIGLNTEPAAVNLPLWVKKRFTSFQTSCYTMWELAMALDKLMPAHSSFERLHCGVCGLGSCSCTTEPLLDSQAPLLGTRAKRGA